MSIPTPLSCLRLLRCMQQKIKAARSNAAPTTEPTTMPAIAPPERWWPELPAAAPAVAVGRGEDVGKTGGIDDVSGSRTPSQRFSTSAATQQESVAFAELWPQKEHRPGRLDW